jgi:class 3 adenylate cyclase
MGEDREREFGLLGEERKTVTVLFCDLVGSTALSEQLDPESLRAVLARYFDRSRAVLERHGGAVEKFIGDAVMAVFGIPTLHEDDPVRAVRAAGELIEEIGTLGDELQRAWGIRLQVRIGVNTGQVVAGDPRAGQALVSGREVNVAARLEQAAAPGEVLVGDRTAAAANAAFEFGEPARIEAKGTAEGVVSRRLLGPATSVRPHVLGSTFVGREDELASLAGTYRRVVDARRPLLVTVVGDAGVGKSSLVRELWSLLRKESPPPGWYTGRCLSYGRGITYWALGEILRQLVGIQESAPREEVLRALGPREILGLTLGLEVSGDLHPLEAHGRLHRAWVELATELVAERPAVFLVEDLHWAEDPLLELLAELVRSVRGPLLVIGTARPELRDGAWAMDTDRLELGPLLAGSAAQMAGELVGGDLPADLRDIVLARSEGNPFFVEELLSSLIDRGILVRGETGWISRDLPANFAVPDSVQAVLAGRIDLLRPLDKAGLQAGSVIGRTFWPKPVRELLEGAEPDFPALEEREFVRRLLTSSLPGDLEFAFKHELTREVAYGSLLKAKRARLHAAFADWLERAGEGRNEWAPLIGHHYAEAVRPEDVAVAWPGQGEAVDRLAAKAVTWLRRAAELAVERYAIDEALALLHRAVELERNERAQGEIWQASGRASALKFDGEGFWAAMQKAIELAGPSAELYSDLAMQTVLRAGMWTRQPDSKLVQGWIDRALELADEGSREQGKALAALAGSKDDETAARSALAIAERLGDSELRWVSLLALSSAFDAAEDFDQACVVMDQLLALLPELSNPDIRCRALLNAVFTYLRAGRLPESTRASVELTETAAGLTPHHRLHGASMRVLVPTLAGRWGEVRELTPEAERVVEANLAAATPCPMNVSTLLNCAVASARAGDESEASRLEAKADGIGMDGYRHWFDPPRIRLALARNEVGELGQLASPESTWIEPPSAFLDALIALGDRERIEAEAPKWLKAGIYAEPFALRALGVARANKEMLDQAVARFEAMGLAWHAAQTRAIPIRS